MRRVSLIQSALKPIEVILKFNHKTFEMKNILNGLLLCTQFSFILALTDEVRIDSDEYCQSEYFQAKCLKNEIILMKTAIYGRMRIGRCIKEKEVAALGPLVGEDPRYLGCSADVMALMDRKCTGKTECDIRVIDISDENIQPCFPGLNVYLEASYSCVSVVDEKRSCVVSASKMPNHILTTFTSQQICGTKSQPWIVEAPVGQKINLTLLEFAASHGREVSGKTSEDCFSYGVIVDKAGKTNTSICRSAAKRETELVLSTGNIVEIFFDLSHPSESSDDERKFILKYHAVGCSDIVPPEDAWLKRNADVIVIGCYSSRQTWHLGCNQGKWVGVLGNCTQAISAGDSAVQLNIKSTISSEEQVLAMVAICGCTLAICLAIACIGAVCLRKVYAKAKKKREYNTLNYQINSARIQHAEQGIRSDAATEFSIGYEQGLAGQQAPTYSVYVEENGFIEVDNSANISNQHSQN